MTPEQQRIAIAEACGWTDITDRVTGGGRYKGGPIDTIPDYLNDLNAMHEAEKTLTDEQYSHYLARLGAAWVHDAQRITRSVASASASVRAEAFLRTLNLYTNTNDNDKS